MKSNEGKVLRLLADLAEKRKVAEQAEYDFFFKCSRETQEMYLKYWEEHKDMIDAPRFLKDYIESRKYD